MKKKLTAYFWLTIFVLFPAIFSQAQTGAKESKQVADASGLLYKITGKTLKNPSYLFGTIHVICSADMIPVEKLNPYIDRTEQVIMELDMSSPDELQAMQKSVMIPGGKTLADALSAEQLAKVDETFKKYTGAGIENLKTVRPFMLEVMLVSSPKAIGCAAPDSYELAILKSAAERKKPVSGLETIASQLKVLESQPFETQARKLYEIAQNPQKSIDDFRKLVETYKSQNSDVLYDQIIAQMSDDKDFQTLLLDKRNKDWMPKIEKAISEKPSFIAVGAGHLGGRNGVVNLLREKGYTVQVVKL